MKGLCGQQTQLVRIPGSKISLLQDETNMLAKARTVRDTTEYSYRRGEATLVEFLDAQRAFNDAVLKVADGLSERIDATAATAAGAERRVREFEERLLRLERRGNDAAPRSVAAQPAQDALPDYFAFETRMRAPAGVASCSLNHTAAASCTLRSASRSAALVRCSS